MFSLLPIFILYKMYVYVMLPNYIICIRANITLVYANDMNCRCTATYNHTQITKQIDKHTDDYGNEHWLTHRSMKKFYQLAMVAEWFFFQACNNHCTNTTVIFSVLVENFDAIASSKFTPKIRIKLISNSPLAWLYFFRAYIISI